MYISSMNRLLDKLAEKIPQMPEKAYNILKWIGGSLLLCLIAWFIYNAAMNGLSESSGRLFFQAFFLALLKNIF